MPSRSTWSPIPVEGRLDSQNGEQGRKLRKKAGLCFFFPVSADTPRTGIRIGRYTGTYRESAGSCAIFQPQRYIGVYPYRKPKIPVRTGRNGTSRPIFKSMLQMLKEAKTEDAKDPIAVPEDLGFDENCKRVVEEVVNAYGRIDILVNNATEQHKAASIEEIDEQRLERVFRTNVFSYFFMTRHALKHMKEGSSVINTTSVTAYKGSPKLLDYTATKGAIVSFTRGLALQLVGRGIRVNGVAPGPIWTPLIPASFDEEETQKFGSEVPMKRAGQPIEVAPCYVFLASNADSSYITGQVLHPNGGVVVNG